MKLKQPRSNPPAAEQVVFLLDLKAPTRLIREAKAEIFVCVKWTWARPQQPAQARRYLLGTSAFYTRAAAERAKLGILRKLGDNPALQWAAPHRWAAVQHQLNHYKSTGKVH